MSIRIRAMALAFALAFLLSPVQAAEGPVPAEKARALGESVKDALVLVEFVVSIQMKRAGQEAPPQERKVLVPGTVVDGSGLTVVSRLSSDPGLQARQQMKRMGRGNVDITSDIKEIKLVLNDGTEVPAEVALRDEDSDIVLVRPEEKPDAAWPVVKLDPEAKPQALDYYTGVQRLSTETGRALVYGSGRVRGIIEKPRTYYVVGAGPRGGPIFDAQGRCFGIYLARQNASGAASGNSNVLPSADVLEIIEQVEE